MTMNKFETRATLNNIKAYDSLNSSNNNRFKEQFYSDIEEIDYSDYPSETNEKQETFFEKLFNGIKGSIEQTATSVVTTAKGIIADIREKDNLGEYLGTLGASALLGLLQPIEQIVDCTVQATAELVLLKEKELEGLGNVLGIESLKDSSKQAGSWIEEKTKWLVGTNWTSKWTNNWVDTFDTGMTYKNELTQLTRSAEDGIGSSMLAKLPGPWGAIASAVTGEGRSVERAYQQGADFAGAALTSHVDGIIGFVTGGIMNKINVKAGGSTSILEALGYSTASAGVSMTGNVAQSVSRYEAFGKKQTDENGNKLYNGFDDYFAKNDALETIFGGVSAFGSTAFTGIKSYNTNQYKNKTNLSMENMTQEERSQAFKDYYESLGAEHVSGSGILNKADKDSIQADFNDIYEYGEHVSGKNIRNKADNDTLNFFGVEETDVALRARFNNLVGSENTIDANLGDIKTFSQSTEAIKKKFCESYNLDYFGDVNSRKIVNSLMELIEKDEFADDNVRYIFRNLDKLKEINPYLQIGYWDSTSAFGGPLNALGMDINDLDIAKMVLSHELGHATYHVALGDSNSQWKVALTEDNLSALNSARLNIYDNSDAIKEMLSECVSKQQSSIKETIEWYNNGIRASENKRISELVDSLYENSEKNELSKIARSASASKAEAIKEILKDAGMESSSIDELMANKELIKKLATVQNNIGNQSKNLSMLDGNYNIDGDYRKTSSIIDSITQSDRKFTFTHGHMGNNGSYWLKDGVRKSYDELLADYFSISSNGRTKLIAKLENACGSEIFNDIRHTVKQIADKMGGNS